MTPTEQLNQAAEEIPHRLFEAECIQSSCISRASIIILSDPTLVGMAKELDETRTQLSLSLDSRSNGLINELALTKERDQLTKRITELEAESKNAFRAGEISGMERAGEIVQSAPCSLQRPQETSSGYHVRIVQTLKEAILTALNSLKQPKP